MNSKKFILQPGKICTLDPMNFLNFTVNGPIFVEIIEEVKHKQGFLKPKIRYFKVVGAGDDLSKLPSPIEVPETYLYPEGMSVIRFPSEFPVINNMDIRALEIIISYLPQSNFVDNADAKKSVYARLNALLDKLKFYSKLDEV